MKDIHLATGELVVYYTVYQEITMGEFLVKKRVTVKMRAMCKFERKRFAELCGISASYLNQLLYNPERFPSPELAMKIQEVSKGEFHREELRPDINWSLFE